ncbi:tellurite resistance TerB family protein [Polycladidibacter hongkongensis]|uniref:tellurite resistance TerB family protein n=1 Tax=Polycladidibacter hongkongensis TaxID=1647556 RepID=UPI000835D428|nr:tellurite resistance TerB family protein [Pseudovibrio hongkongensis]
MFDAKGLLDQFVGSGSGAKAGDLLNQGKTYAKNNAGGLAGGAIAGGLAGLLMGNKKARKFAKKTATYGGLALVGGLAYKAYQDYASNKSIQQQGNNASAPSTSGTQLAAPALLPAPPTAEELTGSADQGFARAILTAMLQAAKADGHIDAQEQQRIFERIDDLGLGVEEKAFVIDEMRQPLDIEKVVVAAAGDQTMAIELYTASRMAIEPDHPAEQAYLQMLAARLALPPELVSQIDATVKAALQET